MKPVILLAATSMLAPWVHAQSTPSLMLQFGNSSSNLLSFSVRSVTNTPVALQTAPTLSGPWKPWIHLVATPGPGTPTVVPIEAIPQQFVRAVTFAAGSMPPPGFVHVTPGAGGMPQTFTMGSPPEEADRLPDERAHQVSLTRDFWMSDHEVTQAEYTAIMTNNPSLNRGHPDLPVENITRVMAKQYCEARTARERSQGLIAVDETYRLPTEAEWEYAARAGNAAPRYGPVDDVAWHLDISNNSTQPIRLKKPNAWGFYDMLGNVLEWCSDDYNSDYPPGPVTNPEFLDTGKTGVLRGGSFVLRYPYARAAFRMPYPANLPSPEHGFRAVFGRSP